MVANNKNRSADQTSKGISKVRHTHIQVRTTKCKHWLGPFNAYIHICMCTCVCVLPTYRVCMCTLHAPVVAQAFVARAFVARRGSSVRGSSVRPYTYGRMHAKLSSLHVCTHARVVAQTLCWSLFVCVERAFRVLNTNSVLHFARVRRYPDSQRTGYTR